MQFIPWHQHAKYAVETLVLMRSNQRLEVVATIEQIPLPASGRPGGGTQEGLVHVGECIRSSFHPSRCHFPPPAGGGTQEVAARAQPCSWLSVQLHFSFHGSAEPV